MSVKASGPYPVETARINRADFPGGMGELDTVGVHPSRSARNCSRPIRPPSSALIAARYSVTSLLLKTTEGNPRHAAECCHLLL